MSLERESPDLECYRAFFAISIRVGGFWDEYLIYSKRARSSSTNERHPHTFTTVLDAVFDADQRLASLFALKIDSWAAGGRQKIDRLRAD